MVEAPPPAPYVEKRTQKRLPGDPEFVSACGLISSEIKQRLDDLLRADFKYLEVLELEGPQAAVLSEETLPIDAAIEVLEEEDE